MVTICNFKVLPEVVFTIVADENTNVTFRSTNRLLTTSTHTSTEVVSLVIV